jgi:hypothetical protein
VIVWTNHVLLVAMSLCLAIDRVRGLANQSVVIK